MPRQLTLLGTGTSVGIPVVGCDCPVCTSTDTRNQRLRSGVLVEAPEGNFLIDTSPELRLQLVRERVKTVNAVIYTHAHADHIFGLDDLRIFGHRQEEDIRLYCEERVERQIRASFSYAFDTNSTPAHKFAVPRFRFERIGQDRFSLLGQSVQPIRLFHGQLPVLGFRINDVAFCTDVNRIPETSMPLLEGLDTLIIDALRDRPHATHFSIDEALEVVEQVRPQRTYLTHIGHWLDHQATNDRLPEGVEMAYDGLRIDL